jgi:hypothetical protein
VLDVTLPAARSGRACHTLKTPEVFVVVGMHKSGTTLIAKTLHLSGISMVPSNEDAERSYDEGATYEWNAFKTLNRDLLRGAREGSLAIDADRSPTALINHEDRCRALIGHVGARFQAWGFKDPRTTLTYPFWRRFLPPHKIVAIYRSPNEVAAHYARQRDRLVGRSFHHWSIYNTKIIECLEMPGTVSILLSFNALMTERQEWTRFRNFVGRDLVDACDTSLYRAVIPIRQPSSTLALSADHYGIWSRLEAVRSRQWSGGTP